MAVSGAIQPLIGAFFFGILFNAASASLVPYVKGHGSSVFRDGLRLVLILFLLSSTLWAFVEFLTTLINPSATSTCQVAVVFSSLFDQLGRSFIEQYLAWAVQKGGERTVISILPQILVLVRLVLGIVFVALTRPDFTPTCVPVSSVPAFPIIVIAIDAVILITLAINAFSTPGPKATPEQQQQSPGKDKAVNVIVVGLAIWMGTSVTLLLEMRTIALFLKTALPAIGLVILVALVAVFSQLLVVPREFPRRPDSPTSQGAGHARDLSSSDSSDYPPSRYEDVKGANTVTMSAFTPARDVGRGITRDSNGNLPLISNPVSSAFGVGGVPVTGELFPPPGQMSQFDMAALGGGQQPLRIVKEARKGKMPTGKGGKLAISHPIIEEDENSSNPLKRIPTIDLATAMNNENARRAKNARRVSTLIAQRPAPRPPGLSGPTTNSESSTDRKDGGDLGRSDSNGTNGTADSLSVGANASSTVTQLSPGTEALRRRSPRQAEPTTELPAMQIIRPGQPVRIPIPRPPEPPQPSSDEAAQPVKTPLQRRPTAGLPSNPRAHAMNMLSNEASNQKQQTVLFMNDITYDDPNTVSHIFQGAAKTPMTPLDSAKSVVNRPRPIPRKSEYDRLVFPAESSPSPGHRRTKSGGSIGSRKSMLPPKPGSPSQLPSLPPLPNIAGTEARPLPNDTKSMTFDEKMAAFYSPAPMSAPSLASISSKHEPTVPDLPPIPSGFIGSQWQEAPEASLNDTSERRRRYSKTTDRSSLRTASILGIAEAAQKAASDRINERVMDRRSAADELGSEWLPGIPSNMGIDDRSPYGDKRKSSPVIPFRIGRQSSMYSDYSDVRTRDEGSTTVWGSLHSPAAPIDVQQSRQNARSAYIRRASGPQDQQDHDAVAAGNEVMTVMLDTSSLHSFDNRQSFYVEDDDGMSLQSDSPDEEQEQSGQFHHRVGEECPTFSTRKERGRSRKIPPTPLLLNGQSTKRAIVVQPAEPSPVESPEAAYQVIQAQLHRFEQPNRDSTESQGRRIALLENLELEMGQLESKWQASQEQYERTSISTIQTMSTIDSRPNSTFAGLSRHSSQRSIATERRASRRARLRSGGPLRSKDEEGTGTPSSQNSSQSSEGTHASLWQARLAEAQMEYMEHAPDLIMRRNNLNFLSVSKAGLGSPSPPETDESESDSDIRKNLHSINSKVFSQVFKPVAQGHGLWEPNPPTKKPYSTGLWSASSKGLLKGQTDSCTTQSVRPATRKSQSELTIQSSRLWQKPSKSPKRRDAVGLWTKRAPEPIQPVSNRPVTIRPPRRPKRMTLLPDIVENPEPLPNKRGTLGIFQFPWGEKSEHPTIQYRPTQMFMAMPGTMTSGRPVINASLEARARQIEASEYSSASFFDEYDEEDEDGDNFDDFDQCSGDEDNDDFDETTLWEIASLLKSEQVPSKYSLLPNSHRNVEEAEPSVLAEYVPDTPSEYEEGAPLSPELELVAEEEPVPVEKPSFSSSTRVSPSLWVAAKDLKSSYGLPHPDEATWETYTAMPIGMSKTRRSPQEEVSLIDSNALWTPEVKHVDTLVHEPLWAKEEPVPVEKPSFLSSTHLSPSLWVAANEIKNRATWESYICDNIHTRRSTPRGQAGTLLVESDILWAPKTEAVGPDSSISTWTPKSSRNLTQALLAATPGMLWEASVALGDVDHVGLFDASVARDFRRTTKTPAAISLVKKHRAAREPLPLLTSSTLWGIRSTDTTTRAKLDFRQTTKTPAAVSLTKKHRVVREPLPVLTSSSLWSIRSTDTTTRAKLWESSVALMDVDHDGLFDASIARDFRRTTKTPAAVSLTKKHRVVREPLPVLTSSSLWSIRLPTTPAKLWESVAVGLWQRRVSAAAAGAGLFRKDPTRTEYRTTSAAPAALDMTRKVRTTREPMQTLQSTQMWVRTQAQAETDWIAMSSRHSRSSSVDSSTTSSSVDSLVTDAASIKTNATEASTVTASSKKTRGFFGWFGKKAKKESSAPKTTDQPVLGETRSLEITEVSKASSPTNSGARPHEQHVHVALRHQHRPTMAYRSDWDEALAEAIVASYPGTIFALRASYPTDWDAQLRQAIVASHISPKITRTRVTPREWAAALRQAVAASCPDARYSRGQALPCHLSDGVRAAIVESQSPRRRSFDAAVKHPVFFGSMTSEAHTVHPVLTGYRVSSPKPVRFDAAVRHPVFFGGGDMTSLTGAAVHPAFHGYGAGVPVVGKGSLMSIARKPNVEPMTTIAAPIPSLWVRPEPKTARVGGMWTTKSQPASPLASSSVEEYYPAPSHYLSRRGRRTAALPETAAGHGGVGADFGEGGMWSRWSGKQQQRRDQRAHHGRNWLEDSSKRQFSRIILRY
ncbi:hypothetical protein GGR56DRAFT_665642 [Xylariaceae sp. FL0804]|nr:hypothetical protein GGR56DRAFT_665642 [Xylariaceae sp. FL0804]